MQENLVYSNVLPMQKSKDGENPQATLVDLAYLAGLWDGEGYVGITKSDRKDKRANYQAQMVIVNTDINIINEIVKILDNLHVSAYLNTQDDNHPKHAVKYMVAIRKLSAIKQLVDVLLPFMRGKKGRAEMMLRFVDSRLSNKKYATPYTDDEISLAEQLRRLNRKESPQRPYVEHSMSEEMVQSL